LVMEYCDGGDLQAAITDKVNNKKYFKEKEIWNIFIQIVRGLHKMHESSVNHRDIKSANIFLKLDGTVKIGDFSAARYSSDGIL
jgi:serine/threonine protein kinase